MIVDKAPYLISAFLFAIIAFCCPVFAEDQKGINDTHIELIPLYASYDTDYKSGTANGGMLGNSDMPFLDTISMRKIVPVIFESNLNSKFVCVGDPITARLKEDLYYGRLLLAHKNSLLKGRVVSYRAARTLSEATFHREDRLKSSSAIGIQFNELILDQNKSIPLAGRPVHQESFRSGEDGYVYGIRVDDKGQIFEGGRTLTKGQRNSANVLRAATIAPVPGGLFINIIAAPVVMGAVGAASPDIAFNRPVDHDTSHRRLKGMTYGFITNLPGAFFVQALVEKGNEVVLSNGDELMIDLAINNISAPPVATEVLKVQGQVMGQSNKDRLLPVSLSPSSKSSTELALKNFIPSSD